MRVVTFKIEEELLRRLDRYTLENILTRSEVIRRAIRDYIDRETQKIITKRLKVWG